MHRTHSTYPVSKKIIELLKPLKVTPREFIANLGYRNTTKGLRRLDAWLAGQGSPQFFRKLCDAFPAEKVALIEALEETKAVQAKERLEQIKRQFEPHIWAETEKEPYNFMSGMLATLYKKIRLPRNSGRIPHKEIQRLIVQHYEKHHGYCESFGEILRYRYSPEYGREEFYDSGGDHLKKG